MLEVALWHAKRQKRVATSLDVLRGVVSDGRDATNECLAHDEDAAVRLYENLFEPGQSQV